MAAAAPGRWYAILKMLEAEVAAAAAGGGGGSGGGGGGGIGRAVQVDSINNRVESASSYGLSA